MSAPEVQVVFQGGGAKFIAMLPVAHAFQDRERAERIKISAVAGASAGAICAALIAANCDFEKLRSYLKSNGRRHLDAIVGKDAKRLKGIVTTEGWRRTLALVMAHRTITRLINSGKPALVEPAFDAFLNAILRESGCNTDQIEDLDKALSIMVTDINGTGGVARTSGSLKEALKDSTAIPLVFRSFNHLSINHFVDGGLTENLPVESLRGNPAPIFAVFPNDEPRKPIDNIFSYLLSLFSVAIEHNVNRAKIMISTGHQFPVACEYSTFDFDAALDMLLDDRWYEDVKRRAVAQLDDFAKVHGPHVRGERSRFDDATFTKNYRSIVDGLGLDFRDKIEHVGSSMVIQLNCDETVHAEYDQALRPADGVTKRVRLKIVTADFKYYRAPIGRGQLLEVPRIWHASNMATGRDLRIRVVSLGKRNPDATEPAFCLIEFLDAADGIGDARDGAVDRSPALCVGDEIELSDTSYRKDALTRLNKGKPYFVRMFNSNTVALSVFELRFRYPTAVGRFSLDYDRQQSRYDGPIIRPKVSVNTDALREFEEVTFGASNLKPGDDLFIRIVPMPGDTGSS